MFAVSEAEGESARHIVIQCGGRIYSLDVTDSDGELITIEQLYKQLEYIKQQPPGPGIGSLTAGNRTDWYQVTISHF